MVERLARQSLRYPLLLLRLASSIILRPSSPFRLAHPASELNERVESFPPRPWSDLFRFWPIDRSPSCKGRVYDIRIDLPDFLDAETERIESTGSVRLKENVGGRKEGGEGCAVCRAAQVEVDGALAAGGVEVETGEGREVGRGDCDDQQSDGRTGTKQSDGPHRTSAP